MFRAPSTYELQQYVSTQFTFERQAGHLTFYNRINHGQLCHSRVLIWVDLHTKVTVSFSSHEQRGEVIMNILPLP